MDKNSIYKRAIEKWGIAAQHGMVIEECAELIAAYNKLDRGRIKEDHLVEEMVDVYIMMQQMRTVYPEQFEKLLTKKLARLDERLKSS